MMIGNETNRKSNAELLDRRNAAVPRGVANALGIFPARASNAEIWDVEGKRYIDFASGIAVLNVGHRHPQVQAAVARQLEQYSHLAFQVTPYEPYVALAEKLNALAPGDFPKKTVLFTTGAEAVENSVKIARSFTGRPGVITFGGAFHGRTLLTLAMTGKTEPYKRGFGPLPAAVYHLPFPIPYHGMTTEHTLGALEQVFRSDIAPDQVAAIVIEPVLGEGGFYAAPADLLRRLREICDQHRIVFVADEIQSGFGRTGRMFAIEHSGVVPDLITVAKSLAGGLPLSGVIGDGRIMDAPSAGGLGGTYGGNPVACAAALAVLDVIDAEGLLQRSQMIGSHVRARLRELERKPGFEMIGNVHGLGAMIGIELVHDRKSKQPADAWARATTVKAAANGLIILNCGIFGNVVRLLMPLTISDALLDEGLDLLERSLAEAVGPA